MIFQDRNKVERPGSLDKLVKGKSETNRAIESFDALFDKALEASMRGQGIESKAARRLARRMIQRYPSSTLFKRYRNDDVKRALLDLFQGKCAYCEKRFAATQPMDVEHFRPKGEIRKWPVTSDGKVEVIASPGYYWLAASWDNLLPSCIDCNRGREQVDARHGRSETLGKQNFFPVEDESKRQFFHSEPTDEIPLLLDPCSDHPEDHLQFTRDGIVVRKSEKGECSIQVYGLNRRFLVEERRALQLRLTMRVSQLQRMAKLLVEIERDRKIAADRLRIKTCRILREIMHEIVCELRESVKGHSEFALLARQMLAEYKEQLFSDKKTDVDLSNEVL